MQRFFILLVALSLLFSAPSAAEEQIPPGTPEESPPQAESSDTTDETQRDTHIDAAHRLVSRSIFVTAAWIDSFFGDERVESETQESNIRLRLAGFAEDGEDVRYQARLKFRLNLPLLEDRLHLLLADEDEDEEEFDPVPLQEVRQEFLDSSENNLSASLRYFFISTLRRNASFRVGARLRSGSPVLVLEPRYRQSFPFDPLLFRFTQRLIWLSDDGLEVRTTLDLDRIMREKLLFRTTVQGSWFENDPGYFYSLVFALFQPFSNRRVLEYSWINSFETDPSHHLEEVRLRILYRQKIWRDWLFYEVAPQVSFPRDRDYEVTPGILLRLEILFGRVVR